MPLTVNNWAGTVDGDTEGNANWSLAHVPTGTERAKFNANTWLNIPSGPANPVTWGEIEIVDGTAAEFDTFGTVTTGAVVITGNCPLLFLASFTSLSVANGQSVDLQAMTIPAASTINGPGAVSNFTWLSPNAGATMTGSTTVAQGATINGTYDGRYGAILTIATLDNADDVDSFVASGGSTANETFSFVLTSGSVNPTVGSHTLRVRDGLNSITINLPDITVIAASTGGSAAITQQQQLIRRHHHHAS